MSKIKPKEKQFVNEFIKNGNNATQAVKKVFEIKNDNYAGVKGHRLIRSDNIQNALKPVLERYQKELSRILDAMENKELDKEQYINLVTSADKIQKQIQLLSGGNTENIKVNGVEISIRK